MLHRIATIVTPDPPMRWHRRLIALKWTYAERFVLSIKSECLGRMILFGESSLRHSRHPLAR